MKNRKNRSGFFIYAAKTATPSTLKITRFTLFNPPSRFQSRQSSVSSISSFVSSYLSFSYLTPSPFNL